MWGLWKKRYDLLKPPPIIGILGPPGAGKSTQCLKLLEFFDFYYMSDDFLIYEEIASGSRKGREFEGILKMGQKIPLERVLCLYKHKIYMKAGATSGFIIEGFPATEEEAKKFERNVTPFDLLIYLDSPDEVLFERLEKRDAANGVQKSEEEIRKSIEEFRNDAFDLFEDLTPKSVLINGDREEVEVFMDVAAVIDCLFKKRAYVDPPECTPLKVCPLEYGKEKKKPPEPKDTDPCPPEKANKVCPCSIKKCPKDTKIDPWERICYGWVCKPLPPKQHSRNSLYTKFL